MSRALVILGKAPQPGTTKTRLSPPLTLEQAARLYTAFLQDSVAMALSLGWDRTTLIYPSHPAAERALRAFLPDEACLLPQPGEGLGAALAAAFQHHLAAGFERVVLIGSDNPTLPAEIVKAADEGLRDHDLVIGPAADGGYYLIAMTRPHFGIFDRITWSTDLVYRETLERARDLGLSVLSLPEWYDVDTVAELERLRDDLLVLPPAVAPATRALLAGMRW